MAKIKVEVTAYRCERCDYIWLPRERDPKSDPVVCSKCKSPYWNKQRKSADGRNDILPDAVEAADAAEHRLSLSSWVKPEEAGKSLVEKAVDARNEMLRIIESSDT